MYHTNWFIDVKLLLTLISIGDILCSIDGTYLPRRPNATKSVDDPCNPLYWYPRHVPDYCYYKKELTTKPTIVVEPPIPLPIPVPLPPAPIPMPGPPVLPPLIPQPIMPIPYPLPFGIPIIPSSPMIPMSGIPFPPTSMYLPPMIPPSFGVPFGSYLRPYGLPRRPMIPPGMTPDGGFNILPFSDAYTNLIEKHKQNMMREYDRLSCKDSNEERNHMKARRHNTNDMFDEDNINRDIGSDEMRKMGNMVRNHDYRDLLEH